MINAINSNQMPITFSPNSDNWEALVKLFFGNQTNAFLEDLEAQLKGRNETGALSDITHLLGTLEEMKSIVLQFGSGVAEKAPLEKALDKAIAGLKKAEGDLQTGQPYSQVLSVIENLVAGPLADIEQEILIG